MINIIPYLCCPRSVTFLGKNAFYGKYPRDMKVMDSVSLLEGNLRSASAVCISPNSLSVLWSPRKLCSARLDLAHFAGGDLGLCLLLLLCSADGDRAHVRYWFLEWTVSDNPFLLKTDVIVHWLASNEFRALYYFDSMIYTAAIVNISLLCQVGHLSRGPSVWL